MEKPLKYYLGVAVTHISLYLGSNILVENINLLSSDPRFPTPWYPPAALTVTLMFIFGLQFVFVALLAQWLLVLIIFKLPIPFVLLSSIIPLGYFCIVAVGKYLNIELMKIDLNSLIKFIVLILAGTFMLGMAYNFVIYMIGVISKFEIIRFTLNFSIGDSIGIFIFSPGLVILIRKLNPAKRIDYDLQYRQKRLEENRNNFFIVLTVLFLLTIASFSYIHNIDVFYLFFVPLLIFVLYFGYIGAIVGNIVINLGYLSVIYLFSIPVQNILFLQIFMIVMTVTSLIIGIIIDERLKTQEKLVRMEYSLQEAQNNENLNRLTSGISHDLNNLLFILKHNIDLLGEKLTEEAEYTKVLQQINDAIERAQLLTDQVKSIHSTSSPDYKIIDLHEEINLMMPLLRSLVSDKNVVITYENYDKNTTILASKTQIQQLLLNLVVNAKDELPNNGKITITTERNDDKIRLIIADDGPGIPDNEKMKVFEPYYTTKKGGSGLGLSIVEGIINKLGGSIKLEDNEPKGTRFIISLDYAV